MRLFRLVPCFFLDGFFHVFGGHGQQHGVVGLGFMVRGHVESECWVNAPAVVIMLHGWAATFQAIPSAIGLIQSPLGSRACRVIGRNLAGTGIGQRHGGGGGYYLGVPTGRITPCRPGASF